MKKSILYLILGLSMVGFGCGSGSTASSGNFTGPNGNTSNTAAPRFLPLASTTTHTVGPSGGTVVATAPNGTRYTLTVPARALVQDTNLTNDACGRAGHPGAPRATQLRRPNWT